MSEFGAEDPIGRALAEVQDEVAGYVRPPGAISVLATVRRRRRRRTAVAGVLALAVLLGPLVAVAYGRLDGAPPGGGPTPTVTEPASVWREYVSCARAHGRPDFPEPAVVHEDGTATFPEGFPFKDAAEAVKAACGVILDRLPPGAKPSRQR